MCQWRDAGSAFGKTADFVPDPFGTHDSFGAHNNARLQAFSTVSALTMNLSAPRRNIAGAFDETLLAVLANYDKVLDIILPTLGEERRKTYSPFLPYALDRSCADGAGQRD